MQPNRPNGDVQRLLTNAQSRQFVQNVLHRLETAGLRIAPELDREIIAVRALLSLSNYYDGDDIKDFFAGGQGMARNSPDLLIFLDLAAETDRFHGFDDMEALHQALPAHADLSDDDLEAILNEHSRSVFLNARTMCIVNEHPPEAYVEEKLRELEALAGGDFQIQSITGVEKAETIVGHVVVAGGRSTSFEIEQDKRPDVTPMFQSLNDLITDIGRGGFEVVFTGSSEDLIAVYLRPDEKASFLTWAGQQHYADGSSPPAALE